MTHEEKKITPDSFRPQRSETHRLTHNEYILMSDAALSARESRIVIHLEVKSIRASLSEAGFLLILTNNFNLTVFEIANL